MVEFNKVKLDLVQFDTYDVPGLIELSTSVGWDYDEHEITTILSSGKIFGHKNAEGKIVSSASIIPYDTILASIGMVIVNEDYRGLGLGKETTKKCIESVSKDTTIMLIATDEGRPLYERLGFNTVDCVHKYICETYFTNTDNNNFYKIESFKEADFAEILKLDMNAFGDSRSRFLKNRIQQAEKCLVIKDNDGVILGFGLSILGPINLILGPIVAPNFNIASLLIDRLSSDHHGKLRIDVPSGNEEFMLFLEKSGFAKVNQPPIMVNNSVNMLRRNNTLYGIAAQIFG